LKFWGGLFLKLDGMDKIEIYIGTFVRIVLENNLCVRIKKSQVTNVILFSITDLNGNRGHSFGVSIKDIEETPIQSVSGKAARRVEKVLKLWK
jgi:hypothetical protein